MSKFFGSIRGFFGNFWGFLRKHRGLSIFIGIVLVIVLAFIYIRSHAKTQSSYQLKRWPAENNRHDWRTVLCAPIQKRDSDVAQTTWLTPQWISVQCEVGDSR